MKHRILESICLAEACRFVVLVGVCYLAREYTILPAIALQMMQCSYPCCILMPGFPISCAKFGQPPWTLWEVDEELRLAESFLCSSQLIFFELNNHNRYNSYLKNSMACLHRGQIALK
ncbi:unnamed protein product [Durusdinium trenchii]|uniref:Uncharacterized protein n=1 Tax=Durusdinium trenchii TaxID=1381693 RepID=A0ABP0SH42_9DINO